MDAGDRWVEAGTKYAEAELMFDLGLGEKPDPDWAKQWFEAEMAKLGEEFFTERE